MGATTEARWEWRVFSDRPFARFAAFLRRLKAANHKTDCDTYIISKNTNANIKIREGMLDIKLITGVSELRAERWRPAFRAHFPPALSDFAAISGCTGTDFPVSFSEGVLPDFEWLRSVKVRKKRDIYLVENAIIEHGTIDVDGAAKWTFCVESADLSQVECFIRGAHMEKEPAANYVTFLKNFLKM